MGWGKFINFFRLILVEYSKYWINLINLVRTLIWRIPCFPFLGLILSGNTSLATMYINLDNFLPCLLNFNT